MKDTTLLWLDDIRNPFEAEWVDKYAMSNFENVVWVKDFDSFTCYIKDNGLPLQISFDHDLGEDKARNKVSMGMSKRKARRQKKETLSGFDCAKWLVDYCLDNTLTLPKWTVHSANPVGADNIKHLLLNFERTFNKF